MSTDRRHARAVLAALALAVGTAGCDRPAAASDAELLLITADSTFWLTAEAGGVRARGVPMLVARVDGRFKELYVTDDDRSYYDAVFVGHRLFARDLVSGDSIELHRDTTVLRLARSYAAAHPDEEPLSPDEPENDAAAIRATSDLEILATHGPYLSYEHHTDVDARGERLAEHRHAYRRGVIDVRTGAHASLASLFGHAAADTMVRSADAEWRTARDTLLAVAGDRRANRVRRAIAAFRFDPMSFSIGSRGPDPVVTFAVPASGTDPDLEPVALGARPVDAPAWWAAVVAELPIAPGEGGTWVRGSDTLAVRVERGTRTWSVALRVGADAPHAAVHVSSAVERVLWLDGTVTAADRAALTRAFAEAADYDGERQVAALAPPRPALHLASHERSASRPSRLRLPPRIVGPDDAAGREHPRARVRRGDPRDARQDGGSRGHAALPHPVRHGVG